MALIINGDVAPVDDAGIVLDEMLFFPGINKNTGHWRKEEPLGVGLHWTGAENPASRVMQTLINKDLSIHFVVDKHEIVQMADPARTRCAHMGIGNSRVGIEIVNRGFATRKDLQGSDLRDRTELDWAESRDPYTAIIDGRRGRLTAFTPKQIDNTLWLVETLSGLMDFPRLIPYEKIRERDNSIRAHRVAIPIPGTGEYYIPCFDRDPRKWGPNRRAKTFKGTLGHFHLHEDKWDPGTQPFYALWAEGWNPLGVKFPNWRTDERFL